MTSHRSCLVLLLLFTSLPVPASASGPASTGEPVDQEAIAKLKMEGFQSSQVMETAFHLTEVLGPRLHGTESYLRAAEWARDRLGEWGLENAHLESFDSGVPVWDLQSYSVEMTSPRYLRINAHPVVWTPPTDGVVSGVPIVVNVRSEDDFDAYRGKLAGAIVLNGEQAPLSAERAAVVRRLTDERLRDYVTRIHPGDPADLWAELEEWEKEMGKYVAIARFFADEGVAALVEPSSRDRGVVRVSYSGWEKPGENAPGFIIGRESFDMIVRLVEAGHAPELRLESRVAIGGPARGHNVIAEIPGSDPRLRDQFVMLGGHLDAWPSGTGATDNAAGCAVVMEAARMLLATGLVPRRTVRVALWDREELDYGGSWNYVERHFADPRTMELRPEHGKLSAYFNLDNGSGRIRGVHLQGNEHVRPIFDAWLEPFHYLEAETLTTEVTWGTDHLLFDAVGLPGFQFLQDPLDYDTLTHHSDQDVYNNLSEPDLQKAAVILASFVYHTAMRDDPLPRKRLPEPRPEDDGVERSESPSS